MSAEAVPPERRGWAGPDLHRQRLGDQSFEPDVLLARREGVAFDRHDVPVEHVVPAVEVVSPGTWRRDRIEKPAQYAAAGIRHYWRIEQDPVHVFADELVGGADKPVADSTVELVLERPFDIRLPIRDVTP
ncbi:Uma2 family endonuclease [Rhizomonospora bruguierae]|uniref:Uma2 family endonuclease n=1 Tax=Rhizomonospora bruguierae TaxID=1581705 RepID=UPI001BCBC588|nr:Uma2 family endonuclease [Micromonospora sp. NBRC 107566]